MSGYSLGLYTSILQGQAPVGDFTNLALDWMRTTRLQGGYWLGAFTITDAPSVCKDWFYGYLGYHVQEMSGGNQTWEGLITEMEYDGNRFLSVIVSGYVHTLNWQYVDCGDGSEGYISTWINTIVTAHAPQLAGVGRIQENTLPVYLEKSLDTRAWDEIQRNVEYGDAYGNPWRAYVGLDRKFYYEQLSNTPAYYTYGGVRRRRSLNEMVNSVSGQYISGADTIIVLPIVKNDSSIARYGKREAHIYLDNVKQEIGAAKSETILKESQWPWAKPIQTSAGVIVYDATGAEVDQWHARPGVYRDASYTGGVLEVGSWFADIRDYIVDEVCADAQKGLSLRTSIFSEADLLEAQYARYGETYALDPLKMPFLYHRYDPWTGQPLPPMTQPEGSYQDIEQRGRWQPRTSNPRYVEDWFQQPEIEK